MPRSKPLEINRVRKRRGPNRSVRPPGGFGRAGAARPEIALRLAVIFEALRCCMAGGINKLIGPTDVHDAKQWIAGEVPSAPGWSFVECCHAVGLDPDAVREKIEKGIDTEIFRIHRV